MPARAAPIAPRGASALAHVPEKRIPVFRKRPALAKAGNMRQRKKVRDRRQTDELMMREAVCLAGSIAIAVSLWATPARALATGGLIDYVQNGPAASAVPDPAAAPQANSPRQIRKAQTELKRLDCLKGRIDGNLGPRTRKAVSDYWAMAKQPAAAKVNITDALIEELAAHGDNYCRPARPFFSFGGGGHFLPPFAPGTALGRVPGTAPKPPAAEAQP
jgi:hypothetical protein